MKTINPKNKTQSKNVTAVNRTLLTIYVIKKHEQTQIPNASLPIHETQNEWQNMHELDKSLW